VYLYSFVRQNELFMRLGTFKALGVEAESFPDVDAEQVAMPNVGRVALHAADLLGYGDPVRDSAVRVAHGSTDIAGLPVSLG
jgi:hypothetical protein